MFIITCHQLNSLLHITFTIVKLSFAFLIYEADISYPKSCTRNQDMSLQYVYMYILDMYGNYVYICYIFKYVVGYLMKIPNLLQILPYLPSTNNDHTK